MANSKSRFEQIASNAQRQPGLPFRVKICGVTSVEDAALVVDAGADAVGLNFFSRSPRFISKSTARNIVSVLPPHVARVGVFVNTPIAEMRTVALAFGLTLLQLHGDESWAVVAEVADVTGSPVIRAVRWKVEPPDEIDSQLKQAQNIAPRLAGLLIDSYLPGTYGGTGIPLNWKKLRHVAIGDIPIVLAGGLSADNVRQAIVALRPAAVDTASGVESAPGRKDPARLRRFIIEARAAFREGSSHDQP